VRRSVRGDHQSGLASRCRPIDRWKVRCSPRSGLRAKPRRGIPVCLATSHLDDAELDARVHPQRIGRSAEAQGRAARANDPPGRARTARQAFLHLLAAPGLQTARFPPRWNHWKARSRPRRFHRLRSKEEAQAGQDIRPPSSLHPAGETSPLEALPVRHAAQAHDEHGSLKDPSSARSKTSVGSRAQPSQMRIVVSLRQICMN